MVKKLAASALRKAANYCDPETKSEKEKKLGAIQIVTLILALISIVLILANLIYDIAGRQKCRCGCDDDFDDDFDDFDDDLDYDPSDLYDDMTDAE